MLLDLSYQLLSTRTSCFISPFISESFGQALYNEQGIPGVLKNLGLAGLIVHGPFGVFDDVWDKKTPESLKNRIKPLILPAQLAGAGIFGALAHKTYHLSSSWFTKSLGVCLLLRSEKFLQSFVRNTHVKTLTDLKVDSETEKVDSETEQNPAHKIMILANVIAFPFSRAVDRKMTRAGFDPISSYAAGAAAFAAVSIVAAPAIASIARYYGVLNSSYTEDGVQENVVK